MRTLLNDVSMFILTSLRGRRGAFAGIGARLAQPAALRHRSRRALVVGVLVAGLGFGCGDGDGSPAPAYTLEISVADGGTFGALGFDITHLGNSGGFIGAGDQLDCIPLVDAIVAANAAGDRVAKIALIDLEGIHPPVLLLRCGFRTRESLGPDSFQIDVTDASDTSSEPLDPPPTVFVSDVFLRD